MFKIINYDKDNFDNKILYQNRDIDINKLQSVKNIIQDVKDNGDEAIVRLCNKFDNSNFTKISDLKIAQNVIDDSITKIDKKLYDALRISYERSKIYHKKQKISNFSYIDDIGCNLSNRWAALNSATIYIPGGTAIYPSSVIATVTPAQIAGVKNIQIFTPSSNSKIDDSILAAAKICNIDNIYMIGGAVAVAGAAFGSESISKTDIIAGPGNDYVTIAKKELYSEIGIDMLAGPTDILIIADNSNNCDWIASDLLSQLEHGETSRAILITDDIEYANKINDSLVKLLPKLTRKDIINKSIKNSFIINISNIKYSYNIANLIAPEHLEIMTKSEDMDEYISSKITNAGAIFLGKYSCEAIGDYIAGPSHTLPTMGSSRFSSGLSIYNFMKRISIIKANQNSFNKLKKHVAIMAEHEKLDAHKLSITIREE